MDSGRRQTVTVRFKVSDPRYAFKVDFLDGWNRDQAGGAPFSWDIHVDPAGKWQTATFNVPDTWVRPIQIHGITTHNWEAQNAKNTLQIQVDDIEVATDIKDVDSRQAS